MKKGLFVGLIIGLVLLGVGGFYWWQRSNQAWVSQRSEEETTGSAKLEFEVRQSTGATQIGEEEKGEGEEIATSSSQEVSQEEIDQLEQEIDQLLNDLNLEEEPDLDFNI